MDPRVGYWRVPFFSSYLGLAWLVFLIWMRHYWTYKRKNLYLRVRFPRILMADLVQVSDREAGQAGAHRGCRIWVGTLGYIFVMTGIIRAQYSGIKDPEGPLWGGDPFSALPPPLW